MGLFTKTRTKRIIPPERQFANAMLTREALRRMTGREDEGEILSRQLRRGRALEDVELERRGTLRDLGERGIEGPGMFNRLLRSREGALGSLIGADTEAAIERRQGAVPILGTLLRENQPFLRTRTKTGALSKAAPFIKPVATIAGGILGGPAGAAVGAKIGGELGKGVKGIGESQRGTPTQFGGTGGSVPQQTVPPTGTAPPGTTPTPLGEAPIGQQDVEQGGGGAIRETGREGGLFGFKRGLGTKKRLQGGLEGLLSAFGG